MLHLTRSFCAPIWLTATLLAGASGWGSVARADGLIVIRDQPVVRQPHPGPHHHPFAPLEVRYHHVTVKITDQVAVTEVDQTFYNPNNQALEGSYLFPIPRGAQIDRFTMEVNGKQVEAELLDAAKARQIYEEIVRKARDPALLEYAGQGLFKVRIFPIEPRSEKRVQLKYTELLRNDNGLIGYTYPLNTEKFSAAPLQAVAVKVDLTCGRPITTLYSPSHAVEITRNGAQHAVVGFEARNIRPDTDFQLLFATADTQAVGLNLLTYRDGGDPNGGYLLMLGWPTNALKDGAVVAKDVVFVLDTSGSMGEGHKLDQARRALRMCLQNLGAADRFELVRFSTEAQPLFGKLAATDQASLARAEEFVDQLKPLGGTAIASALNQALESARAQSERERPCFIVFLTDGLPTVGETNPEQILAGGKQASGDRPVRIFCFGLGTDVNTHLLDGLAEQTRAASQYVLPNEDIEVKVSSFYAKISQPVLANMRLRVEGGVQVDQLHPAKLGDLFKGEQFVVVGRYTGEGGATVTLEGTVNGEPQTLKYPVTFAAQSRDNPFIPRLWATRRVGYLLDQIRLHGEQRELREEVTALARQYGIVTPYTAYLITEDEARRNVPAIRRTMSAFERDETARLGAREMYDDAKKEQSGPAAVGGAKAAGALRGAAAPTPAAPQASEEALAGYAASRPAEAKRIQEALESQTPRYVGGRTFYPNDGRWVDALAQGLANAQPVRVAFGSDEYFDLLAKHPEAAAWLSIGSNVQYVLDDTLYEVYESAE